LNNSYEAPPAWLFEPASPAVNWRRTRPTTGEVVRHAALFFLTVLTTFAAGIFLPVSESEYFTPALALPVSWVDYLIYIPAYILLYVFGTLANASAPLLIQSAFFSFSLLAILSAHEAGHYIACRLYGVEASLPFFIPAPPPFPAGTFGAFIKMRAPIPYRRALFDIAVAGPLAGFIVIIPVAILGISLATPAPPLPDGGGLYFNDPLLLRAVAFVLGTDVTTSQLNGFLGAAWFGLLVTSLNLLPVGQLDGGHISYALFGERAHRRLGIAGFIFICLLAPLGWWYAGVPSNVLYAVLLLVMLRMRHPQALDESDALGNTRIVLAIITLAVLVLSFLPFPLTVT